ncbi:hypothetical protein MPC4_340015 [Methylocella tundrae]|uniref:Uncharacterized protein n=1 Tax=Methylocella tundrae TaxID=227605 RepID=A0A8B6M8Z4_METTU|nr:hypothetical protein MPC4_340015 [Methylocella tundrae]
MIKNRPRARNRNDPACPISSILKSIRRRQLLVGTYFVCECATPFEDSSIYL